MMENLEEMTKEEVKTMLDEYSDLYYNTGESPITDAEFDELVRFYNDSFNTEYNTETPVKEGKRLVEITHSFPNLVGTIAKAQDMNEFSTWLKDIARKLDTTSVDLYLSEKYDGNSVVLTFDNDGLLVSALTRGKAGKGLDLSKYFEHTTMDKDSTILAVMEPGDEVGIKCEVLITYDDFDKLSTELDKTYSNPRNLTAGILNSNDGYKYRDHLTIAPLAVEFSGAKGSPYNDRDKQMDLLNDFDLENMDVINVEFFEASGNDTVESSIEDITELYNEYVNTTREDLPYMIDGLVVEVLNKDQRESLGRIGTRNNFDVAIKFPSLTKRTKMVDIKWYMGKTGRVTPVATVEPVIFNGAVCDHVSLSNINRFEELDLHKDESVILEYHGDVLSYLINDPLVDKGKLDPKDKFEVLDKCPICESDLVRNKSGAFLSCNNPACDANIVGKLVNFFEKLDIKGLKEATVSLMVDHAGVEHIEDLYELNDEVLQKEGKIGEKTRELILTSIQTALSDVYDYQFFGSLGIEGIGRTKSESIFSHITMKDIVIDSGDSYELISHEDLSKLLKGKEGIGKITIDTFYDGLETNFVTIATIFMMNEDTKETRVNIKTSKPSGTDIKVEQVYSAVFTGFRNNELKEFAKENGYAIRTSVSGKTDYVVAKDTSSTSSKVTKGYEVGAQVMSIEDFANMIGFKGEI